MAVMVVIAVTGTGAVINADEGAVLSQAQVLNDTGDWGMTNPNPVVDPEGRWFPLDLSDTADGRWFPYTKHVAYPAAVSLVFHVGGLRGVLFVHGLCLVAAAAIIGLSTRSLARRAGAPLWLDRVALWAVLLASPAIMDAFWVIAHAPALLCASIAAGLAAELVESPSGITVGRVSKLIGLGAAVSLGVLLRSEATLFGVALGLSLVLWSRLRAAGLVSGAVAGVSAVAAHFLDAWLEAAARGGAVTPFVTTDRVPWLEGRVPGFVNSVLRTDLGGGALGQWLVLAATALTVVAWWGIRRGAAPTMVRGAAIGAATLWVARMVFVQDLIPGLVMAFPLLIAGAFCVDRQLLGLVTIRMALVAATLYAAAVVATQYAAGGSGDWGGRYLRLLIPLVIPVLVVSLSKRLALVDRPVRRVVAAGLIVSGLAASASAVLYIASIRPVVDRTVERLHNEAVAVGEPDPLIVSTRIEVGRFSWRYVTRFPMLSVPERSDLPELAERLSQAGVRQFVLVTPATRIDQDVRELGGRYEVIPGQERETSGWSSVHFRSV